MRKVIVASLVLLALGQGGPEPIKALPEPKILVVPEKEHSYRQVSISMDAMSYALQSIGGIPQDEADLIVQTVLFESARYEKVRALEVLGIMAAESKANRWATSHVGARGLMQIMPGTGRLIATNLSERWRGPKTLYEIERNVRYGIWYLNHLRETFPGNDQAVLAAYNWGPGHIRGRLSQAARLPEIYPELVRSWERRVRREIYVYYEENYWRSDSPGRNPPLREFHPTGPESIPNYRSILSDDGEGQLLPEDPGVQSAPGDLSRGSGHLFRQSPAG